MESVCKRCLLDGLSQGQFEKTLDDFLDSLPSGMKADSVTIRNRLSVCGQCEHLFHDICRICGCFAKARAAKQSSCCPAVDPKW